jgi:hypothetical protein
MNDETTYCLKMKIGNETWRDCPPEHPDPPAKGLTYDEALRRAEKHLHMVGDTGVYVFIIDEKAHEVTDMVQLKLDVTPWPPPSKAELALAQLKEAMGGLS